MAFNPQYDQRNINNIEHFVNFKKIYSDGLYIVMSSNNNTYLLKGITPFNIFIRKEGEIYGDPLVANALNNSFSYKLYLYNENNIIENIIDLELLDNGVAELKCEFDKWTVSKPGVYRFKVSINDLFIDSGYQLIFK